MSILQKDHVFGAGGSAVLGGVLVGGLGFAIGGPPGLVIGVVAGTAGGALIGHRASEAADPRGNLGHFEQIYQKTEYYVAGMEWNDYAPAYQLGIDSYRTHGGQPLETVEATLGARWLKQRGGSRLSWDQARDAVVHVWRELGQGLGEKRRH